LPDPTLRSGGIRSGDLGVVRPDGFVELHERLGDVIKAGGERVLPAEVEAVLRRLPGIVDAVVFGVDDRRKGERVEAAIVWDGAEPPDHEEIRRAVADQLAGYAVPDVVRIMDRIPLTANMTH
jgi:fatty-acyl-CoA synthase